MPDPSRIEVGVDQIADAIEDMLAKDDDRLEREAERLGITAGELMRMVADELRARFDYD